MSNLQVIARRCPVMSKALAVQSIRGGCPLRSAGLPRTASLGRTGGTRSYVVPTSPVKFSNSDKKDAEAANIESVHLRAGVFDTSKGKL